MSYSHIESRDPDQRLNFGARIFLRVSVDFPAHVILQSLALVLHCRKTNKQLNEVLGNLNDPTAIALILERIERIPGHVSVSTDELTTVLEDIGKWSNKVNCFSDETLEYLVQEYGIKFKRLKDIYPYELAFFITNVEIIQKFFYREHIPGLSLFLYTVLISYYQLCFNEKNRDYPA